MDDLTLSPDQKSIQKQAMAAAKTDPNVDYAINPTFTAELNHLIAQCVGRQSAAPAVYVMDLGFSAFLKSENLGLEGMFGDFKGDEVHTRDTPPDTSRTTTFERQPFGIPSPPQLAASRWKAYLHATTLPNVQQPGGDVIGHGPQIKTTMAQTFVDELTEFGAKGGGWKHNLNEPDACEMSAQIFKACDRVILKLMLALSTSGHGRKAHQQRHDFSKPKNPLTSVTKMVLHMNPRAVHTTMHVRPSVCDVLFNVCLPGQNTMLAAPPRATIYGRQTP